MTEVQKYGFECKNQKKNQIMLQHEMLFRKMLDIQNMSGAVFSLYVWTFRLQFILYTFRAKMLSKTKAPQFECDFAGGTFILSLPHNQPALRVKVNQGICDKRALQRLPKVPVTKWHNKI